MWKNQTTPNLHTVAHVASKSSARFHPGKPQDLSLTGSEPKKGQENVAPSYNIESLQFCSSSSKGYESRDNGSELSFNFAKKINKEEIIVMELEENEELRLNLFRAEKTIEDLDHLCKDMQKGIAETLLAKREKIMERLNDGRKALGSTQDVGTQNRGRSREKENRVDTAIQQKQIEITEMWKVCHSEMIEYVSNYTKDISILI